MIARLERLDKVAELVRALTPRRIGKPN